MRAAAFPFNTAFLDASGKPSVLLPSSSLTTNLTFQNGAEELSLTGGDACAYADLTDDGVTRLYVQFPLAFDEAAVQKVSATPPMGWGLQWYVADGRRYLCLAPKVSATLTGQASVVLNLQGLELANYPLEAMLPFTVIYCVGATAIQAEADLALQIIGALSVKFDEAVCYVSRSGEAYANTLRLTLQNQTDVPLSCGEIQLTLYCETDTPGEYDSRAISTRSMLQALLVAPDPSVIGWSAGIGPTVGADDPDAMIWTFTQDAGNSLAPGASITLEFGPELGLICPLALTDGRAATVCVAANFSGETPPAILYASLPLSDLPPVSSQMPLALDKATYAYGDPMSAGWILQFATYITLDWNDGITPRHWSNDTTDALKNLVTAFSQLPTATVPGTLTLRAWNTAHRDKPQVQSVQIEVPKLAEMTASVDYPFATNLTVSPPTPITYTVGVSHADLVKSIVLTLIDGSTRNLKPDGTRTVQFDIVKAGTATAVVTFGTGIGQPDKVVTISCPTADLVDLLTNHQWQDMNPDHRVYCNYIGGVARYGQLDDPTYWLFIVCQCFGNAPPINSQGGDTGTWCTAFVLEGNTFKKVEAFSGDTDDFSLTLTNTQLVFLGDGLEFDFTPNQYPVPVDSTGQSHWLDYPRKTQQLCDGP